MEAVSSPVCSWEICWAAAIEEAVGVRPRQAALVPGLPEAEVVLAASTAVAVEAASAVSAAAVAASMAEAAAVAAEPAEDKSFEQNSGWEGSAGGGWQDPSLLGRNPVDEKVLVIYETFFSL